MPEDRGKQVVIIVCHSASQNTQPFHFLGLLDFSLKLITLRFELAAHGNVFGQADHTARGSIRSDDGKPAITQPTDGAIRANDAVLTMDLFARSHLIQILTHDVTVFLMNAVKQDIGTRINFIRGTTEDAFICRTDIQDRRGRRGRHIHHPKHFMDVFGHLSELFFALLNADIERHQALDKSDQEYGEYESSQQSDEGCPGPISVRKGCQRPGP
jgi:hypothetical protein